MWQVDMSIICHSLMIRHKGSISLQENLLCLHRYMSMTLVFFRSFFISFFKLALNGIAYHHLRRVVADWHLRLIDFLDVWTSLVLVIALSIKLPALAKNSKTKLIKLAQVMLWTKGCYCIFRATKMQKLRQYFFVTCLGSRWVIPFTFEVKHWVSPLNSTQLSFFFCKQQSRDGCQDSVWADDADYIEFLIETSLTGFKYLESSFVLTVPPTDAGLK